MSRNPSTCGRSATLRRLGQGYSELSSGDGEHLLADIDAENGVTVARDGERLAGNKAGGDRDVKQAMAGPETRPPQARAAVSRAGAERKPAIERVVITRGSIEEFAYDGKPARRIRAIAAYQRMCRDLV